MKNEGAISRGLKYSHPFQLIVSFAGCTKNRKGVSLSEMTKSSCQKIYCKQFD